MAEKEIVALEHQIFELTAKLNELRRNSVPRPVPNYRFATLTGDVTLLDLFAGRDRLLAIHNMGQACRYCTLWADGFNGMLSHLENAMSVALLSGDPPSLQRDFANSRDWRFRLASHGGGDYISEQTVMADVENMPGAVFYVREGEQVLRKNSCVFGPGDLYCSLWSLLGLAGMGEEEWTPQYRYWRQPEKMDDGGANLLE